MVGAKAVTSPSTSLRLAQQRSGVCSVIVSLPFYQVFCCGPAPCTCCCHPRWPPLTESPCSRLFYILLHVGTSAVCCLLLSRMVVERVWGKARGIQMPSGLCAHLFGHSHCPVLSGSGAVYRVCAGTATFHLLQAVLLVDLHSPTSLRAQLHKRCVCILWLLFLLGLCAVAFCMPDEHLFPAWHYIGICRGFTFILLQLVLITAFAHSWNKNWQTGAAQDCPWFLAVPLTTLGFYSMADGCLLNKMLLSLHLCCCGLLSFLSIAPCIRLTMRLPTLLRYLGPCGLSRFTAVRSSPHSVSAALKQWSQRKGKEVGLPGQLTKRQLQLLQCKPSSFPIAILPSTSSSSLHHSMSWLPSPTGSAMRERNWKRLSPQVAGLPSGSRLPHAGPVYSSIWGYYWHHSVGPQPKIPSLLFRRHCHRVSIAR
uniref:Serine incorporator 4 n=1 Tax=Balaenoptera musculus TaxID=9771 RepID=A0A8C0CFI0_BALMU